MIGCEQTRAFLGPRGGGSIYAELPFSSCSYGRRLDDISSASVTVGVTGLANELCCAALADLTPWRDELSIWRGDELAWLGPVQDPSFEDGQVTITARDLFAWFERRRLPLDRTFTAIDLATIFDTYANDALAADTSPNISVNATATGVLGDRAVLAAERRRAADELRELARTGVDFSTIGRTVIAGGSEVPATAIATFITEDISDAKVVVRGSEAASDVSVVGASLVGGPPVGTAAAVNADIGSVQVTFSEPSIRDQASADAAAQTRLDMLLTPPEYLSFDLNAQAPVSFSDLVPGARVDHRIQVGCRESTGTKRLLSVQVAASPGADTITLTLLPLGTT